MLAMHPLVTAAIVFDRIDERTREAEDARRGTAQRRRGRRVASLRNLLPPPLPRITPRRG
jgi:hypothetical protein